MRLPAGSVVLGIFLSALLCEELLILRCRAGDYFPAGSARVRARVPMRALCMQSFVSMHVHAHLHEHMREQPLAHALACLRSKSDDQTECALPVTNHGVTAARNTTRQKRFFGHAEWGQWSVPCGWLAEGCYN